MAAENKTILKNQFRSLTAVLSLSTTSIAIMLLLAFRAASQHAVHASGQSTKDSGSPNGSTQQYQTEYP
jgi:hypothetical protein